MLKSLSHLKVFLASPSDMDAERTVVKKVIISLNQYWNASFQTQVELIAWETHAVPSFGSYPQGVINDQLGDDSQIFIGLLWSRFGTPTSKAPSGTLEEFDRALSRFKSDPLSVDLMIYFKNQPIPPNDIDTGQLEKVHKFKKRIYKEGGLYRDFDTTADFESLINLHLLKVVQKWVNRAAALSSTSVHSIEGRASVAALPTAELVLAEFNQVTSGWLAEAGVKLLEDTLKRLLRAMEAMESLLADGVFLMQRVAADLDHPADATTATLRLVSIFRIFADTLSTETPVFAVAYSNLLSLYSNALSAYGMQGGSREPIDVSIRNVNAVREFAKKGQGRLKHFRGTFDLRTFDEPIVQEVQRRAVSAVDLLEEVLEQAQAHGNAVASAMTDLLA